MTYLPNFKAPSNLYCRNEQRRPTGVVPHRLLRRLPHTAVHFTSGNQDPLQRLVEQSHQVPVVQLPATSSAATAAAEAARPHFVQRAHQDAASCDAVTARHDLHHIAAKQLGQTVLLPGQLEQRQGQQGRAHHYRSSISSLPELKLRPSRMDFETMLRQLAQWKAQHLSAHVPRFCFDAPELGAWVRFVRKQHKDGLLEQWKVTRLNSLQFEWELPDQEARWHHLYHQLRRYRLLYGSSEVDTSKSGSGQGDWPAVARWLNKQGRLLAKQKLSGQKVAMLQLLEVTLRLPKRLVHRTAQLQALNGPERRKLRKKWKQLDAAAAEQEQQQRRQEQQQQRELERQQELVASRRQALLSSLRGSGQQERAQTLQLQQQQRQQQQQQVEETLEGCSDLQQMELAMQEKKQRQQLDTLFYQRNCRGRKARQKTRQEKWLETQQQRQEHAQGDGQP